MENSSAIIDGVATGIYNPEKRVLNDTRTLAAEMLDGHMRTPFEFTFDGEELYSDDGSPLKPVFEDSLKDAKKLAPNLGFELRRVKHDLDEYDNMIDMANGKKPNTMLVVRDFPQELWNSKRDVRGYNVKRKQTMLCAIGWDGSKMFMCSQSLDHSNRTALEAIYNAVELEAQPGELYGQRIQLNLAAEDQALILDQAMGIYDRSMAAQYGGEWRAGRRDYHLVNTYDFVCAQTDLVNEFLQGHDTTPTGRPFFNLMAAIDVRFQKANKVTATAALASEPSFIWGIVNNPQAEMRLAGFTAERDGKSWSGCGVTVSQTYSLTLKEKMVELGIGLKVNPYDKGEEEDKGPTEYDYDILMFCEEHQAPPDDDDDKVWCGPCGFCEPCDKEIQRRNKLAAA